MLFLLKADQRLSFSTTAERVKAGPGDTVLSYGPPREEKADPAKAPQPA